MILFLKKIMKKFNKEKYEYSLEIFRYSLIRTVNWWIFRIYNAKINLLICGKEVKILRYLKNYLNKNEKT